MPAALEREERVARVEPAGSTLPLVGVDLLGHVLEQTEQEVVWVTRGPWPLSAAWRRLLHSFTPNPEAHDPGAGQRAGSFSCLEQDRTPATECEVP